MNADKISIAVADDHKLFREMWVEVLNQIETIKVIASCSNGYDAMQIAQDYHPQIFLMDISMKEGSGFEATSYISRTLPDVRIIAVTAHAEPIYVRRMLSLGARGYVTKNSSVEDLMEAITTVMNNEIYICREVRESKPQPQRKVNTVQLLSHLSQREREILYFIREGLSSREIGERLHISLKTVEAHRYNIIKKLQVKNMAALLNEITGIASGLDPLVA